MIRAPVENTENKTNESMTPMIDVIFTLIAFMMLMINSPLLTMKVSLPEAQKDAEIAVVDIQKVTVSILPTSDQWQLNKGKTLDQAMLTDALALLQKESDKLRVLLVIDKDVPVQRMITTIAILNTLKITGSQVAVIPDAS